MKPISLSNGSHCLRIYFRWRITSERIYAGFWSVLILISLLTSLLSSRKINTGQIHVMASWWRLQLLYTHSITYVKLSDWIDATAACSLTRKYANETCTFTRLRTEINAGKKKQSCCLPCMYDVTLFISKSLSSCLHLAFEMPLTGSSMARPSVTWYRVLFFFCLCV